MKILVTGGTGFIGNHLCRKLLFQGHTVICLDNNFTGAMANIMDLMNNSNFTFIQHDVTEPLIIDTKIDQIYHLACPASPCAYQFDPIHTIKTNVLGTLNVLGIAKKHKCRILLTSTSEVYGDPTISPQTEDYWGNVNPIGIRSCYDEGKRMAETLMMEYNKKHHIDTRIVRIFNTYGSNMNKNDGRVVSNFINQCLENKNITIYGDGSQTRSFCYVDDTVDGLVALMNHPYDKRIMNPVNIGNPHEITVKELAETIKIMTGSKSEIIYTDLPQDDPMKRKPDITKAMTILHWQPKIDLKNGLEKTIQYFSQKFYVSK